MPQDRISGARANRYGRTTARKVARQIGAVSLSANSNEFKLKGKRVTIRCARVKTNQLGTSYKLLERVKSVIAALEQENGEYELYEITPEKFKANMRETRSKGRSAGKVGLVRRSLFVNEGRFLGSVSLG